MHRRLGEHLATTPLAKGLSAAIVARHLARGEAHEPAAELYLEAASAARAATRRSSRIRYYQRALALLPAGRHAPPGRPRGARGDLPHARAPPRAPQAPLALRSLARKSGQGSGWRSRSCAPRGSTSTRDISRAGCPIAQRAPRSWRAPRKAAGARGRGAVDPERDLARARRHAGRARRVRPRARGGRGRGDVPLRASAEVLRAKRALLSPRRSRAAKRSKRYAEAIAVVPAQSARAAQEARAKNSLAFAMFVLERFEDAIALALSSLSIDLAIGGRFQIAKTLTNIGQAYARLGDQPRALAYLKRARDAHERYGDQDSARRRCSRRPRLSSRPAISTPPTSSPPTLPRSSRSPTRPTTSCTSASCARASRAGRATSRAPFATPKRRARPPKRTRS